MVTIFGAFVDLGVTLFNLKERHHKWLAWGAAPILYGLALWPSDLQQLLKWGGSGRLVWLHYLLLSGADSVGNRLVPGKKGEINPMYPPLRNILFCLLSVSLLGGCWDAREIEERTSVIALAFDKHPTGYEISVQVPIPLKIVGSGGGGGGESGQNAVRSLQGTGKTFPTHG